MPRTADSQRHFAHGLFSTMVTGLLLLAGCGEPYVGVDPPPAGQESRPVEMLQLDDAAGISHADVNFDEAVRTPEKLIIVDFWAHWCGPCRMLAPELEKIVKAHPDDVVVLKVNVDKSEFLAAHFGAGSIPDLRFFRDGKAVGGSVGFRTADELLKELRL